MLAPCVGKGPVVPALTAKARLLCALAFAGWAGASAAQDGGEVAAGDVLRLRVVAWDDVTGQVIEWTSLSGDYEVAPDGAIRVPFVGSLPGAGRSRDAIADDVRGGLREGLALLVPPEVSVEFASRRPVTVTGDVVSPGPYEFRNGMVALQAVGLAGGAALGGLATEAPSRRQLLSDGLELELQGEEELRLLARQARLEAELAGADRIEPPEGRAGDPGLAGFLMAEERLLQVRQARLAEAIAAAEGRTQLLQAQIDALGQKQVQLEEQRRLAVEEAQQAGSLAEQGLLANARLADVRRLVADSEQALLDVSTAILVARQDLAAAEQEPAEAQNERDAEVLEALQEVDGRLDQARGRAAAARSGLAGAALPVSDDGAAPVITLYRPGPNGFEVIPDAGAEPLRPGDMVEVRLPFEPLALDGPDTLPAPAAAELRDEPVTATADDLPEVAIPEVVTPEVVIPEAVTPEASEAGRPDPDPEPAEASERLPASAAEPEARPTSSEPALPPPLGMPVPPIRPRSAG